MTEESNKNENIEDKSVPLGTLDLNFDFSPDWARKSSSEITFNESKNSRKPGADSRRRPSAKRKERRSSHAPGRLAPNRSPDRNIGDRSNSQRSEYRERNRPYIEMPPVQVRFLPEQNKLSAIARKIHSTKQAYPLADLASLVLSSPDSCYIKLESRHDKEAVPLYQCKECRAVGLNRDEMLAHVADEHLDSFFDKESVDVDAPSGTFPCVAKCGLSGEIIGPPNHHSYNQRVKEVHSARYPNISLDEYRQKIITVKDDELIEKWKEESRHQVLYRLKTSDKKNTTPPKVTDQENGEAELAESEEAVAQVENDVKMMDKSEAYKYCLNEIAPKLVMRTKVASLPLNVARNLKDPGLNLVCRAGWRRENRFPRSLLLALRAALKHMQLYIFKMDAISFYVTSVKPLPLDSEYTVAEISEVLDFLNENPNCKRVDLITGLRPGKSLDSEDAEKVLTQLHWLIERGHIIEFFDGTLSVSGKKPKKDGGSRKSEDVARKTKDEEKASEDSISKETDKKPEVEEVVDETSGTEKADSDDKNSTGTSAPENEK